MTTTTTHKHPRTVPRRGAEPRGGTSDVHEGLFSFLVHLFPVDCGAEVCCLGREGCSRDGAREKIC